MAGFNYTGLRMKRLPHALFGHTVRGERGDLVCHSVHFFDSHFGCQQQLQVLLYKDKDMGDSYTHDLQLLE